MVCALPFLAQARTITGVVTDQTGETVISASVVVKGTTIGTVTDFDGNYSIDVPDDAKVLIFSFIGLETQELPITGDVMNVVLKENSEVLEEVVVTGYGTTKKRDLVTAVASVSAEQLKDIPVASASEALQGKLAGVTVTTTEGAPDADVKIRVRGGTSLTQSNDPLYIVDGFPVSSISDIAPTDIASMDVLKGAAATAIYGAQGANGVIIITTKDSDTDSDKMTFHLDYTGYVGWKKLANKLENLDNRDFMLLQYENFWLRGERLSDTGFPGYFIKGYVKDTPYDISSMLDGANDLERTDWMDKTFGRTGFTSNHSISVTGGNKNANFTLSYNRMDDKAIMQGSDYARNNLSLKAKFKPFKDFTISFTTRYTDTKVNGAGSNATKDKGTSSESRLRNAFAYTPIKLYNSNSEEASSDEEAFGNLYDPLTTIDDNYKFKKDVKWNIQGYFSYKFLKHFTWRSEIGYELRDVETDRFYGKTTYFAREKVQPVGTTAGLITAEKTSRFRQTNTFNWEQTFKQAHNVSLLLVEEIIMNKGETTNTTGTGFPATMSGKEVFEKFANAQKTSVSNYIAPTDNMLSFVARANYNYKSRYYISGTFRADASTRFSKEHQWGLFPAGAVAWNMAEESWMEPARSWMSQLKIRFDYGMAGNNNVDLGYLHTDYLVQSPNDGTVTVPWFNGFSNILIAGGGDVIAPNPNLKWETTISRNLGIDYGFFNQRLSGSIDLYWNTTKDLIIKYGPLAAGYNYQYRNIGSTRNMGVEFSVNAVILDKRSKNLHYNLTVNANVSHNSNKITDLGGLESISTATGAFSTANATYNEFELHVGESMGNFYGYVADGYYKATELTMQRAYSETATSAGTKIMWPEWSVKSGVVQPHADLADAHDPSSPSAKRTVYPGMLKLKDQNGDGKIDENDRVVIGNALPVVTGGFSVNFNIGGDNWGQVDLGLNFTYSIGNDVLNLNKVDYTTILRSNKSSSNRNMLSSMAYGNRYALLGTNGSQLINFGSTKNYNKATNGTAAILDAANEGVEMWAPYMNNYVVTDWAVEDGSFLRLNQLTIGYSLADKWISKAHISKLRIYFQMTNVFCATKYSGFDPEVDVYSSKNPMMPGVDYSAYPKTRGYNVGLNLSF